MISIHSSNVAAALALKIKCSFFVVVESIETFVNTAPKCKTKTKKNVIIVILCDSSLLCLILTKCSFIHDGQIFLHKVILNLKRPVSFPQRVMK